MFKYNRIVRRGTLLCAPGQGLFIEHFINPAQGIIYNHCVLAHKHNFCKRGTDYRSDHNIEDKI